MDPIEHAKKLSSLRKDNNSDDRFLELSTDKPMEKAVHSDDSDEEPELTNAISVDLKPGLNILVCFFQIFSRSTTLAHFIKKLSL